MREHQIVITLKPEQFLRVQKLARDAGAKSMGMFVRQQLLAALGIEGQSNSTAGGQMNLEPMVSELKRLHGELREIVAESLVAYSADFGSNEESSSVEVQADLAVAKEDPQRQEESPKPYDSITDDEMEQTAERTFAISPRLGPLESLEKLSTPLTRVAGDQPFVPEAQAALETDYRLAETDPFDPEQKQSAYFRSAETAAFRSMEDTKSRDSSLEPAQGHGQETQIQTELASPALEPAQVYPDLGSAEAEAQEPEKMPAGYPEVQNPAPTEAEEARPASAPFRMAEAMPSEAEETPPVVPFTLPPNTSWTIPAMSADEFLKSHAAALSMDSGRQDNRDPLSELLGADISAKAAPAKPSIADDDDDAYDVPLSILARRQQMAAQLRAVSDKPDSSQSDASKDKSPERPAASVPPAKPDKPELREESPEKKMESAPPAKEPKTAPSPGASSFLANYRPLENPDEDSHFSGGPPPKRQQ